MSDDQSSTKQRCLKAHGLAISLQKANAVGFTPDDDWQCIEYEFGSGEVTTLFITTMPRLVVVRRGPLSVKDRDSGLKLGTLRENYDAFLADKLKFKTFTRHLIFLVGQNKKFLHHSPLQLTLNGAAGATFSLSYCESKQGKIIGGFVAELEKAYAEYRQQPVTAKGSLFHAHGIYCPFIDAEEKGSGANKAWVATTVDYQHPTAQTLTEYLIPANSEESEIVCKAFEEHKSFGKEKQKLETSKVGIEEVPNSYVDDDYDYGEAPY